MYVFRLLVKKIPLGKVYEIKTPLEMERFRETMKMLKSIFLRFASRGEESCSTKRPGLMKVPKDLFRDSESKNDVCHFLFSSFEKCQSSKR